MSLVKGSLCSWGLKDKGRQKLNLKCSARSFGAFLLITSLIIGCADNEGVEGKASSMQVHLVDGTDFFGIPLYKDNKETFVEKIRNEIKSGNESLAVLVRMKEGEIEALVWASLDKQMAKVTGEPFFKLVEAHPQWQLLKIGQGIHQDLSKIYAFRLRDQKEEMVILRTRDRLTPQR
jgi:hypothetical protein